MLDIIICEDNRNQRKQIESITLAELENLNYDINIKLSTDKPEKVIGCVKSNPGKSFIYLLDVELKSDMNGIELAKIIRQYDSKGYIIFITSHSELSLLTFQYKVQALDYILKTDVKRIRSQISECIQVAYTDYKNSNKEDETITINFGNRIVKFSQNEILFFETTQTDHKLRFHTEKGQYEFYGKMKDIETKLSSDFYKTHRSYLINTKKIKFIDKDNRTIHMSNDEICYVSARYLKGLIMKCLI